jgi:hypothetical protein
LHDVFSVRCGARESAGQNIKTSMVALKKIYEPTLWLCMVYGFLSDPRHHDDVAPHIMLNE